MKLIVAQMRNLNPMDPSSGSDSMPMMMQAETLNQLVQLNTSILSLQQGQQTGYAAGLIGKSITGIDETGATVSGTVQSLMVSPTGILLELTGGALVPLAGVAAVSAASAS
jgi:flagellar basal-body rod modification protein FlgD